MINIKEAADMADMIVNGFAYIKDGNLIRVINLKSSLLKIMVKLLYNPKEFLVIGKF